MSGPVKRAYSSPLRSAQARATRGRILDTAQRLFTEQGYARTSVDAIAAGAAVSPDTVYATFGSKRELLKQLMDRAVSGDEGTPILEQDEPRRVLQEPDPRRMVAAFAAGVSRTIESARPIDDILRSAAAVDADIAALRDDLQQRQRRGAMTAVARHLASRGPLRDRMSAGDAAAIIWTLTSPEVHRLLRDQCGWSQRRYARWLGDTLERTLLPD